MQNASIALSENCLVAPVPNPPQADEKPDNYYRFLLVNKSAAIAHR